MPILKSSIKRARQNIKRKEQLRPYKTRMLTLIKNILKYIKIGEIDKAEKNLSDTYSAIDKAKKKNIINNNNASRKKSRIQKAVNKAKVEIANTKPEKDKINIEEIKKKSDKKVLNNEKIKENPKKSNDSTNKDIKKEKKVKIKKTTLKK